MNDISFYNPVYNVKSKQIKTWCNLAYIYPYITFTYIDDNTSFYSNMYKLAYVIKTDNALTPYTSNIRIDEANTVYTDTITFDENFDTFQCTTLRGKDCSFYTCNNSNLVSALTAISNITQDYEMYVDNDNIAATKGFIDQAFEKLLKTPVQNTFNDRFKTHIGNVTTTLAPQTSNVNYYTLVCFTTHTYDISNVNVSIHCGEKTKTYNIGSYCTRHGWGQAKETFISIFKNSNMLVSPNVNISDGEIACITHFTIRDIFTTPFTVS